MKRAVYILIICILLTACSDNDTSADKTITIASMGSYDNDWSNAAFIKGVELAIEEVRKEYSPLGYTINYSHYDDEDDYSSGMLIVDQLVNNKDLTAVIGSNNFSILEMAAHRFEDAGVLMIAPHGIPSHILTENKYKYTLSITYSSFDIGAAAREYAINSGLSKWAVCYFDNDFNRDEVKGFSAHTNQNSIEIIDYLKIPINEKDFDYLYKRWDALGVQGVFIVPDGLEGYDILRQIKKKNPELAVIGDYAFDAPKVFDSNSEYMQDFVMIEAFFTDTDRAELLEFAERFIADGNEDYDTWANHGYDSVRMIVDTAVKNGTTDPGEISETLRTDGYEGVGEIYVFIDNGELSPDYYSTVQYRNGIWNDITSKIWGKQD